MTTLKELLAELNLKTALKAALAADLAWAIVNWYVPLMYHRSNAAISGLWCVITAVIVLQGNLGSTFKAAFNRFLGTFIGSFIGAVVTVILGSDPFTLGFGIFLTVILCSFLKLEDGYRIANASTAVVIILYKLNPEIEVWLFSLYRFVDATAGIIVALLIAHFIWPSRASFSMQQALAEILLDFKKLLQMILLLDPHDQFHRQEYRNLSLEIVNDLQKTQKILEESRLEMFVTPYNFDQWKAFLYDLDHFFEHISNLEAVYYSKTKEMMTPELQQCIENVFENIYKALDCLSLFLTNNTYCEAFPSLHEDLLKLNESLLLFRSQHRMRTFDFIDVENFFVFVHSTKSMLQVLSAMKERLENIHKTTQTTWNFLQSNPSSKHSES